MRAQAKRKAPQTLTLEAFEAATRADRALTVEAYFDSVLLAFCGELIAMSPCGTMCAVDYSGEPKDVPASACRILP